MDPGPVLAYEVALLCGSALAQGGGPGNRPGGATVKGR